MITITVIVTVIVVTVSFLSFCNSVLPFFRWSFMSVKSYLLILRPVWEWSKTAYQCYTKQQGIEAS